LLETLVRLIQDVAPMQNIIEISSKRIFNLEQAQELLPVIYRITESAQLEVKSLINRLEAIKSVNLQAASDLELTINAEVERWHRKIERLGASPKGLWLADFDNGTGYYCWKFPETEIGFWHGYREGYTGRKPILQDEDLEAQPLGEKKSYENCGRSDQHYSRKLSEEYNKDH